MIQRGHISVMGDVLGFYKLQIWRGVCRRKDSTFRDESSGKAHIYQKRAHSFGFLVAAHHVLDVDFLQTYACHFT